MSEPSLQEVVECVSAGHLFAAMQLNNAGVKQFDPVESAREIARLVAQELENA